MAFSTYKTFLMHKEDSTWKKLVDITSFPAMGGAPEMISVTTLSDPQEIQILGVQKNEAKTFGANYDKEDFAKLKALEGVESEYALWFGGEDSETGGQATPTGDRGKFHWTGSLSVYVKDGGVNAVAGMEITISASSSIEFE